MGAWCYDWINTAVYDWEPCSEFPRLGALVRVPDTGALENENRVRAAVSFSFVDEAILPVYRDGCHNGLLMLLEEHRILRPAADFGKEVGQRAVHGGQNRGRAAGAAGRVDDLIHRPGDRRAQSAHEHVHEPVEVDVVQYEVNGRGDRPAGGRRSRHAVRRDELEPAGGLAQHDVLKHAAAGRAGGAVDEQHRCGGGTGAVDPGLEGIAQLRAHRIRVGPVDGDAERVADGLADFVRLGVNYLRVFVP